MSINIFKIFIVAVAFIYCKNLNSQIITTIAGNGNSGDAGDGGLATLAELYTPEGLAIDTFGNLYIADTQNHKIRKIDPAGIITTIAGTGSPGFSGDGGPAILAQFNLPYSITLDKFNNIYISDVANGRIRMINSSGIITTVVGNGVGFGGDGGPATLAKLREPLDVVFDTIGNMFICEYFNNRIRKIDTAGIITTFAGIGTQNYSGDGGPASLAEFNHPYDIAIDKYSNIYIADYNNSRLRMINSAGIINTVVGSGIPGFSGDGGQAILASFNGMTNVITDYFGNLYITDKSNQRIRKIDTIGIVTTIVGNGTASFGGDGGFAVSASLFNPGKMILDKQGNMYIADRDNNRIRKIDNSISTQNLDHSNHQSLYVYPNPTSGHFTIKGLNSDKNSIDLFDINGKHVYSGNFDRDINLNVSNLQEGFYFIKIKTLETVMIKSLIISK